MILSTNENNKVLKFQKKYSVLLELSRFSGMSSLEIMMVILGYKPAVADAINYTLELKRDLDKIRELGKEFGLYLATSKYKYIVNSPKGIFEEIPLTDPDLGKIILSFAKSKDKSRKGADYYHEKMLNSEYGYKFGKLMGYPECCLRFGSYLNNNEDNPNNLGFKNPAVESLKRSKHFAWQLNVFTVSLLPHYPCSLTCQKSITYVDTLLACLNILDHERAQYLTEFLIKPASLYWTCADKILLYGEFKQSSLGSGEIMYSELKPLLTSENFYQKVDKQETSKWHQIETFLKKGNRLIVTDKLLKIYLNHEKILEITKDNKYTPILIKPDILP